MDDNEKQIVTKKNPGVFITVLNDNDVLQGRGSGSMQNTGNIRFRTMVEELRPAYVATSSRKEKAKMITSMVKLIQSRQGRFLQPVNESELEELSLSSNAEHFVEMSDKEAAEKAKQAIRYVHYKKVPLEDKRRKKRMATTDASSLRGKNDQLSRLSNKIANVNGVGYISNNTSMMAAMFPNRVVDGRNFQSQQITAMPTDLNINSMAHFGQQAHVGQMTLLSTNNLSQPSPTLSIAQQNDTHNLQQQQPQPHPHQFNALFQSLIQQQQQHHQHQQQQQQLLEALQQQQQNQKNHQQQQQQLLEALQHQQKQLQISSTIQSMHQTQKPNSETNPMLAMLSNTNQSLQTNPALSSLMHQTFPASSMNQQSEAGTMMLSNQSPSMLHGQQSNSIAPGISAFLSPTPLSSQPGAIVIGNSKVVQSIDGGQPNGNNNLETVQGFGSTHFPFNTAMDNINSNTNSVKSIESTKRVKLLSDNISQEAQV